MHGSTTSAEVNGMKAAMESERGPTQKSLLTKWVVSSTVGWTIGLLGSIIVAHLVNLIYPKETNLVVGLCVGGVVGYAQWSILKKHIALSGRWVLGCAIGMGTPFIVLVVLEELGLGFPDLSYGQIMSRTPIGIAGGLLCGLLQMPLLRPVTDKSTLWILASTLGYGSSWLVSSIIEGPNAALVGLVSGGIVLGLITGVFMKHILKSHLAR
jgi:hypothetical protein